MGNFPGLDSRFETIFKTV